MRRLILIAILTSIFQLNLIADDKIGITHELGLQITGSYDYNEPEFMHTKSKLESQLLDNFGLVYNFKNSFVLNDFLTEFEFDSDFRRTTHDYWSDQSGTQKDIENDILNLRALYGFQLNDKLMLKSGLGYRYLKHKWAHTKTSDGSNGYDRIQDYAYIPILAEINMPVGSIDGILKLEYDQYFMDIINLC